jgi:hypothetical protein
MDKPIEEEAFLMNVRKILELAKEKKKEEAPLKN